MNLFARILSIVLQPVFIPTYGFILLTIYDPVLSDLSLSVKSLIWLVALLTTCIIPSSVIGIGLKTGIISDSFISNRKQRPIPYIFTILGYIICILWLSKFGLNLFYTAPLVGAIIGLLIMLPINHFWKISAHLSAFGGLCGAVFTFALIHGTTPILSFVGLVLLSGILGWARMELKAHTFGQVCCGWLNGFLCVSITWLLFL